MSGTQAARSASFVGSIGVNQHLSWTGSVYDNAGLELQELQYLGVSLVRDGAPAAFQIPKYQYLANAGVRFDLTIGTQGTDLAQTLQSNIANVATLAQSNPGSIEAVEAPNELNQQIVYWFGAPSTDPAVADAIVQNINAAVRGNPTLASQGVATINVSLNNVAYNWRGYMAGLGNLSSSVDYANWHVYFVGGVQPAANVAAMYQDAEASAPGKPVIFTEGGYFTAYQDRTGWGGVDNLTQAKNILNLLADAYKAGVAQTFIFQLMEGTANPSTTDIEDTFGIFQANGTPKPAATAVHNLTSVLADPAQNAQTFSPGSLNYSISNLPSTGNSLLLEKASGAFDLLVWAEPPDWNPTTQTEIQVNPTPVTVQLGAAYQTVNVFDPLQGSGPIQTLFGVSSVSLGLTDHPLIIEVEPQAAGDTISNSNAAPVGVSGTLQSGTDSLVLHLSEDAYKGDAQFTLSVDGTQIGGIRTVTATHGQSSQAFAISGNFGAGTHDVKVTFVNDTWAPQGPAFGDRNLYIDAIRYDGSNVSNVAATLYANGGVDRTVFSAQTEQSITVAASNPLSSVVGDAQISFISASQAIVTLGSAVDNVNIIGMSHVNLTAGSGNATIQADGGNNVFTAGSGRVDITGGSGADAYIFHVGGGAMTIEDFSFAKGDTLSIDASLAAGMTERADGSGGSLLTFGNGSGSSIDIAGAPAFDVSRIALI